MDSSGNSKENSSISNITKSNVRKRKNTCNNDKIPAKRRGSDLSPTSSSSVHHPSFTTVLNEYLTETQSSSDCYSTTTEFDIGHLGSPDSVISDVLSPLDGSSNSWNMKGDTTPHGNKKKNKIELSYEPNTTTCSLTPSSEMRISPLPKISWADSADVWRIMCRKDDRGLLDRDPNMINKHPALQARMRSILLDWLSEVCEVYKLHRETYYLAIDYLDRFLNKCTTCIAKTHLQLIGITCLFIAAKVEEIYPPKIGEFAYVTDGACTEDDILQEELIILTVLNWQINPVTIMGWLGLYMQLNVKNFQPAVNKNISSISEKLVRNNKHVEGFVFPQFSGLEFCHTAQLIDVCALDVEMANFSYSVIAAAAISHTMNRKTAMKVSGLEWKIISPCAKWMEPYFQIIKEETPPIFLLEQNEQIESKFGVGHISPNIVTDDSHIIQTHSTSLELFDKACIRREQLNAEELIIKQEASPAQLLKDSCTGGLLTPPATIRKPIDSHLEINVSDQDNITNSIIQE